MYELRGDQESGIKAGKEWHVKTAIYPLKLQGPQLGPLNIIWEILATFLCTASPVGYFPLETIVIKGMLDLAEGCFSQHHRARKILLVDRHWR